jgi:hypothetical protein
MSIDTCIKHGDFLIQIFGEIHNPLAISKAEWYDVLLKTFKSKECGQLIALLYRIKFVKKLKFEKIEELKIDLKKDREILEVLVERLTFLNILLEEVRDEIKLLKQFSSKDKIEEEQLNDYFEKNVKPLLNELNSLHLNFNCKIEALKDIKDMVSKEGGGRFSERLSDDLKNGKVDIKNKITILIETNRQLVFFNFDRPIIEKNYEIIKLLEKSTDITNEILSQLDQKTNLEELLSSKLHNNKELNDKINREMDIVIRSYKDQTEKIESEIEEKELFIKEIARGNFKMVREKLKQPISTQINDLKKYARGFRNDGMAIVSKIKYKRNEIGRLKFKIREIRNKNGDDTNLQQRLQLMINEKTDLLNKFEQIKKIETEYKEKLVSVKEKYKNIDELSFLDNMEEKMIVRNKTIKTNFENLYRQKHNELDGLFARVKNIRCFILKKLNLSRIKIHSKETKHEFFEELKDNLRNFLVQIPSDLEIPRELIKLYLYINDSITVINGNTKVFYNEKTYGPFDRIIIDCNFKNFLEELDLDKNLMIINYENTYENFEKMICLTLKYLQFIDSSLTFFLQCSKSLESDTPFVKLDFLKNQTINFEENRFIIIRENKKIPKLTFCRLLRSDNLQYILNNYIQNNEIKKILINFYINNGNDIEEILEQTNKFK